MNDRIITELAAIGVETERTIQRFSGNAALYEKFLLKFPQDDNFSKIKPALDQDNYEEAFIAAHTLKGVAGNLGMVRLFQACSDLVAMLRAKEYQNAKDSFVELETAYQEVNRILDTAGE